MRQRADERVTLYLIRGCLQLTMFLSVAEIVLSLDLFTKHSVDNTMMPSEILTLFSSFLSITFVILHSVLASRHQRASPRRAPRSRLQSICSHLPPVMILLWMASSVAGLVVAARQTICLPGEAMQDFWRIGTSCRIHRVSVGLALLAFITSCILFPSLEVSCRPFQATFFHVTVVDRPSALEISSRASDSHSSDWTGDATLTPSSSFRQREKSFCDGSISDLEFGFADVIRSPSSVYHASTVRYSSPSAQFSTNTGSHTHYSRPHTSHSSSYSGPTRTISTLSTLSTATSTTSSSSSTRRSPLSTMRRASEPEVPVIPDHFKQLSLSLSPPPSVRRSSTLPSFLPIPLPPPLSADTRIRELSGGHLDPSTEPEPLPKPQPSLQDSTHHLRNPVVGRPGPRSRRRSVSPPPRAPGHTYHPFVFTHPHLKHNRAYRPVPINAHQHPMERSRAPRGRAPPPPRRGPEHMPFRGPFPPIPVRNKSRVSPPPAPYEQLQLHPHDPRRHTRPPTPRRTHSHTHGQSSSVDLDSQPTVSNPRVNDSRRAKARPKKEAPNSVPKEIDEGIKVQHDDEPLDTKKQGWGWTKAGFSKAMSLGRRMANSGRNEDENGDRREDRKRSLYLD